MRFAHSMFLDDFLATGRGEQAPQLEFEQLPFSHPLFILFSSGTTGAPKCMVHSAGVGLCPSPGRPRGAGVRVGCLAEMQNGAQATDSCCPQCCCCAAWPPGRGERSGPGAASPPPWACLPGPLCSSLHIQLSSFPRSWLSL